MNTTLNAIDKLDLVLNFLYENPQQWYIDKLNEKLNQFDRPELIMILHRLRDDKYVILISEGLFQISFNGSYFKNEGGYAQNEINKANRLQIEKDDHSIRMNREKRLSDGTVLLAVGTFLIVIWDIIKTFCIHR